MIGKNMKLILLFMSLFALSGCQGFRYYDAQKPHRGKDRFYNNYDRAPKPSFWKWQWERLTKPSQEEPTFAPEVLKTDVTFLQNNRKVPSLTWIGHSTSLLQIDGINILMDPIFSERASPVSFLGPRRLVALPFALSELPPIEVVLVSHSHYDHLDLPTLRELAKRSPDTVFLVPLGNKELLVSEGLHNVHEMDWWNEYSFKNLKLTLTPAQHWSRRTLFDTNQTLWGGWHIRGSSLKVFFAGDTAYSQDFVDIRARLGSVDLALIPVGAYEPRWFMASSHTNPDDAVKVHLDLGAKLSIGVHWGTFRISDEFMTAPVEDLRKATEAHHLPADSFRLLKHGEVLLL
ncbi:MAG: MBL fold metallo-hydrolase [Bdellovibrio sp.]